MSSFMVSGPIDPTVLGQPQGATRNTEQSQQVPALKFKPRNGRGSQHDLWELWLESTVKVNLLSTVFGREAPTKKELTHAYPTTQAAEIKLMHEAALIEYTQLDNKLFELVRPTLDIYTNNRFWQEDHQAIEALVTVTADQQLVKRGNELVKFARQWTLAASEEEQANIRTRLVTNKLAVS